MTTRAVLIALGIMLGSLLAGVLGYHYTEGLPWIDSLLNASMILGGMGPVDTLKNWESKLFASFYALYSCFMVLGLISILVTPAMHKALRAFHAERDRHQHKEKQEATKETAV